MDYRIKDLPEEERPREKLDKIGASRLSSVELLSIILRTGTSGKNVKELAAEILNHHALEDLASLEREQLEEFDGISRVKSGQLKALGELALRTKKSEKDKLESLADVKGRVADMKFLKEEHLRTFYLSSGNKLLAEDEHKGGIDSVDLDLKKLFRRGIVSKASAVILAHNHPSGKSRPTEADIETTREARELGERLGINVLDHVIVGDQVYSLRKEGLAGFQR
ncbi:MAG: RadC family protein [Candidatus Nanohaloarchaea archaeon]